MPSRRPLCRPFATVPDPFPVPPLAAALLVLAVLLLGAPAAPCRAVAADRGLEVLASGWSPEGFIDPAAGEGQRAQITLRPDGGPIAVWAGRASDLLPYQILVSTFDGTTWSAAQPAFPATEAQDLYPQWSRAADGTLWLGWLRNDDRLNSPTRLFASLLTARYENGAWSAPETVTVNLIRPDPAVWGIEFSLMAVSRDSAWVAFATNADADPFALDRDLYFAARSAAGWGVPALLSNSVLAETRPLLAPGPGGAPVAIYGFADAKSRVEAQRWNGVEWRPGHGDTLTSWAIFEHAAAPDSNGALRYVAMTREGVEGPIEDHIRLYAWNDSGFHAGPSLASVPVLGDQPEWRGLALESTGPCATCEAGLPEFRAFWVDVSSLGAFRLLSTPVTAAGLEPIDLVGTALDAESAFPDAVYDAAQDRWWASWVAPPATGARRRAKFAYTQTFAGDIGIGAIYRDPDTVRVTLVCSGDATGRQFDVYRLKWDVADGTPPGVPPVPAAAVLVPGSPVSGPCPVVFDDFPLPGRYYYYVALRQAGTFPADYARSANAVVVPEDQGGTVPDVTLLLPPRPNPAQGPVTLPLDLAGDGTVRLVIQDVRGRRVRTLDLGPVEAGEYRGAAAPQWDGRDQHGRTAPSGVYVVRLLVNDGWVGDGQRIVYVPTGTIP